MLHDYIELLVEAIDKKDKKKENKILKDLNKLGVDANSAHIMADAYRAEKKKED